jgi:hypothetical protein
MIMMTDEVGPSTLYSFLLGEGLTNVNQNIIFVANTLYSMSSVSSLSQQYHAL